MHDTVILHRQGIEGGLSLVVVTANYKLEEDKWLGECLELGTATFGDTLDEVRLDLVEALKLQLNEVESLGFIDSYLREHGVRLIRIAPMSPEQKRQTGTSWKTPTLAGVA